MSIYDERPWLKQYRDGVPEQLTPQWPNALAMWDDAVGRNPDAPCILHFEETLSFGRVDADSDALAAALIEGGVRRGDRVGIYLQNDPQWPITLLAAWKAGAMAVSLNPMFKAKELTYHLVDSGATVLVCQEDLYRSVASGVVPNTSVGRVITTHPADWQSGEVPALIAQSAGEKDPPADTQDLRSVVAAHSGQRPDRPEFGADDVAMLTYTSGTTGPAKGAMNTHGNLVYNSQVYRDWPPLESRDVILAVAPLFHITGIVAHMTISFCAGIPMILFHRFDPAEALRMIERHGATFTVASITVFMALMNHPDIERRNLSSLTKTVSGGAPVSPKIVERFEGATGAYIHNIYGLTETTSPSHWVPFGNRAPVDETSGALSVGVPVPGCVVRVVDLETGEEVPPGQQGELWTEGPMVVAGYWEKPEETENGFPDRRLRTGDVGFMGDDGWFYIVDRAKDQINAAGYKVWPREVEDVLYQHEAVREAAVIGVPDEYRGETVKAYVALVAGKEATSPDDLIAFCKSQMAAYKYPRQVEILDELPKTPTGKFLRRELRDRERARSDPPS
ncbi:MAG: AMP-binding protein [Acidimicrobiia bacterium]